MGRFPVSPAKEKALLERMKRLGVRPEDVTERFVRASGPGGQRVNRAATCVVLRHGPTGLTVRCQQERSQGLNRFLAWRRLLDKLEQRVLGTASQEQARIERIRRQKQRRCRRARKKRLAARHRAAEGPAGPTAPEEA